MRKVNEINLHSRSSNKVYLKWIIGNKYELIAEGVMYIRFGLTEKDGEYYFIDPEGGPFMQVGEFKIENRILKTIKREIINNKTKYFLIFEENGN